MRFNVEKIVAVLGLCFLLLINDLTLMAQEQVQLWSGIDKPFYKENELEEYEEELWGIQCLFNVTEPTLTYYVAMGENSKKAVLIIPGGGYGVVANQHEGHEVAKVLSENGITAAVLKYRIPNPASSTAPEKVPLTDARRAMTLLRARSLSMGFDPNKIVALGFSAGAHLATSLSVMKTTAKEEKPNFSALIYGVTELSQANLTWLEESLYFRKLTEQEKRTEKLLDHVSNQTPPAFLIHAYDDEVCPVRESTLYAASLQANNVPVEMHLFPKGGHGFGMGRSVDGTDQWVPLFINWLRRQ